MKSVYENLVLRVSKLAWILGCILPVLTLTVGCGDSESFVQTAVSENFVQEYNPHYLEVLWMIDDRSPMRNYREELTYEAGGLFSRLDGVLGSTGQYKMAITNADGRVGKVGVTKPVGNLLRDTGSLSERLDFFSDLFYQTLNLSTDPVNQGLAGSLAALKSQAFGLDPRIPLVVIYLSYSNDESPVPTANAADPVGYFAQQILALKNNKADLVRVYAANYLPLAPGVSPNATNRCALETNNEIDVSPSAYAAKERYFKLAQRLGGQTADLCSTNFQAQFDLTGLQLKTLPKIFPLQGSPDPATLKVDITFNGQPVTGQTWTYDASIRSLVFDQTPPEGVSIVVTYTPAK